jgi:hypothetical protein
MSSPDNPGGKPPIERPPPATPLSYSIDGGPPRPIESKPVTSESIRSLWQSMPTTPVTISADEMRARMARFEKRIQRRNLVEYVATAFVVAVFGWYATWPTTTILWPVANILIILGALYVAWRLHRYAAARPKEDASITGLVDFHRAELVRQRGALLTVWRWYLLPFVPGTVLWLAAAAINRTARSGTSLPIMPLVAAGLVIAALFFAIFLVNLLGAAHLQRRIDELDRYRGTE